MAIQIIIICTFVFQQFRRLVADNYASVTTKHYRPYQGPDGREPLPNACKQTPSGFVRQKPLNIPTTDEVGLNVMLYCPKINFKNYLILCEPPPA